ncbi:tail protein (endogenous virus) [Lactococcus phage KSY1]|uniref:Gp068 n=1 Tax=Lactococcus phage KSY1 TaxID=2913972 RepID=A6MAD3_9CAUD|nr:tail protein [Lactococcus phage KSY1]ABG21611.1 gp068 [Lactococcus phage KSY1]
MAELTKIYEGIDNGVQITDDNFGKINAELTSGGNVVHKTGDESIGGRKTFTTDMTVKNISASGSLSSKIVSRKMDTPAIKHTFIRTGNMVTLTTETKSGIAQTTAYSIPSGYRPFNDGTNPIYEQVLSGGKSAIIRSSNAKWQPRESAGLDGNLFGTIRWPTKDSFPDKFPINRYKLYVGQDGAKVGNEYWLFGGSSPDHNSTDYIHRINPTDFSEIGLIKHNLGHANGVDYRNNALLVYNGSAFPPEINLYKNPDNTKTELKIQDSANTQIIFKESNKLLPGDGSACFGIDRTIVYYAYSTGGTQMVILKILLGLGNNDLSDKTIDKSDNQHWGSFVSGKSSDDYNGTAQIIASYTGDISGNNQPQGMAFDGDLYLGISIQDPKAYQLQLFDEGIFKVVDIYNAEMTDSGNNVIPLEPEITLIDPTRRRLFIGSTGGDNNSLSNLAEFTLD